MKAFSSHKHGNNTGMCLLLAHNKKGCIYIKLLLFNFIGDRDRSVLEDILDIKYSLLWDPHAQ